MTAVDEKPRRGRWNVGHDEDGALDAEPAPQIRAFHQETVLREHHHGRAEAVRNDEIRAEPKTPQLVERTEKRRDVVVEREIAEPHAAADGQATVSAARQVEEHDARDGCAARRPPRRIEQVRRKQIRCKRAERVCRFREAVDDENLEAANRRARVGEHRRAHVDRDVLTERNPERNGRLDRLLRRGSANRREQQRKRARSAE